MLPFPKRKATSEVELDEADFVLETSNAHSNAQDSSAHAAPMAKASPRDPDLAETVQRAPRAQRTMPPPGSRRILDEDVEEDVAGQCLASIAAETSRDRDPYSSSHIRLTMSVAQSGSARSAGSAPIAPVSMLPPPLASGASDSSSARAPAPLPLPSHFAAAPPSSVSRLPAVTAPPFLRTTTVPLRREPEAPGIFDSSPPPAFVRRSSPVIPAAAPSSYASLMASSIAAAESKAGSVAPVSITERPNEPTVIVVRERPRAAWIVAAAAMGALGAIAATRFLAAPADERPAAPTSAAAAAQAPLPALPSTVVLPPAVLATSPRVAASPVTASPVASSAAHGASTSSPAVVRFGDDQGVAIKAPAPQPRRPAPASPSSGAAPATKPAQPARAPMGPALPDGSFGLGRAESTPAPAAPSLTASVATSVAATPGPESPRRRALTPEQQLAEAQLKASMK